MAYVTQKVDQTQQDLPELCQNLIPILTLAKKCPLWVAKKFQKNPLDSDFVTKEHRVLVGILEVLKISRWTKKMTPNQCLVPLTQWEFPAPPRPEVLLRPRHPLPSILLVGLLQVLPEKHQHAPPVVAAKPANW